MPEQGNIVRPLINQFNIFRLKYIEHFILCLKPTFNRVSGCIDLNNKFISLKLYHFVASFRLKGPTLKKNLFWTKRMLNWIGINKRFK